MAMIEELQQSNTTSSELHGDEYVENQISALREAWCLESTIASNVTCFVCGWLRIV